MKKQLLFFALFMGSVISLQAQTIAEIVANSPDHNTLEAALDAAELTAVLDGTDEYTLFAPTDAAFDALPENLVNLLLTDPSGVLTDVLLYHVAGGTALSTDLSNGMMVPTLSSGQNVIISIDGTTVMVNMATVTGADIAADNGVVHVIDAVLVPETTTIYDVVVNSPDHNTLEAAIDAAELDGTLSGPGAFTLFAPTDAAFDALPEGLVGALLTDPTGLLADILLYHAVGSIALSGDLSDEQNITTINGQDVTVNIDGGDVFINDAQVSVVDIPTINGVVHVIDAVLVPEATTVYDVVVDSPDHNTLEAAIDAAELDGTLSGPGTFTLFAPTDAAFEALPDGLVEALLTDPTGVLTDVLLYHAVGSIALSSDLSDQQNITTINGQDVTVNIDGGDVFINDAQVTVVDIPTINGVVHVIDAVLVPEATTVYDVVVDSPDHNTLEAAIDAAELDGTLSGPGAFTLFAPTDAAFEALPDGLVEALLTDPSGVLTDVLLYHAVGSIALSSDLSDQQNITTINGQDVTVNIDGGDVFINDAQVTVVDIPTINGVVHVIDAVLVPEATTVYDVVVDSPDHNTLEAAIDAAELDGTLSGPGAFTLFAPTDAAFEALPDGLVEALLTDPSGVLTDVLLYHAVGSIALSSDLSDQQNITTINGQNVTVSIDGDDVFINNAQVTVVDIPTINGVVHVIDAVLVPDATTVYDVVEASDVHTTLETAIGLVDGLEETLSGPGTFTLFAPTDDAFQNLPAGVLNDLISAPDLLEQVLLYHALGSIAISTNLVAGPVATLQGEDVEISLDGGVMVNDAMVTVADIVTINGVVHVIDAVLVPSVVSVDEIDAVNSLGVFPNPANDQLTVELDMASSERISIDFVNLLGQVVKSVDLGQRSTGLNREMFNVRDLANGMYLMNITVGDSQVVHKVQVSR